MAVLPVLAQREYELFPANGSVEVNPDTHLSITFASEVRVGEKGRYSDANFVLGW